MVNTEVINITKQQSESSQNMLKGIRSINSITTITEKDARKNKNASYQLQSIAEALNDLINKFRI